jgi:hypothetical protein
MITLHLLIKTPHPPIQITGSLYIMQQEEITAAPASSDLQKSCG